MTLVRLAVSLAAVALATGAFAAQDAVACSCIQLGDPRVELRRADGAFVGVYLRRRPLKPPGSVVSSLDTYVYVFRVTRRVKGRIGRTIQVRSPRDGASCGLEVVRGQRVALLLRREQGAWHSDLCSQRPANFFRGVPSRTLSACG